MKRHYGLSLIASGRAVSLLGDTVASTALVLHAHAAGWGPAGVAAVIVCGSLPLVLGAPLAGRLVDRVDSHRLTVVTAVWEGLAVLALAAVLAAGADGGGGAGGPGGTVRTGGGPDGAVTIGAVLALLVLLNAGQAVSGPAWTALLPAAVPAERVGHALGVVQAAATVASLSGSVVGGVLVGGPGVVAAMVLDAVTFAVLAVAAVAVRARRRPEPGPVRPRPWTGVTVLGRDAVLGPLVGGQVVLVLSLHIILVTGVFLVRDVLHGTPAEYGLVGTGFPVGMLLGSLVAARAAGTAARVRTVLAGFGGLAAGVLACGLAPGLVVLWGAEVVVGVSFGAVGVLVNALILDRVPDAVRGRALAAYLGAMQACNVVGTLVGAPITAVLNPRTVYVIAGTLGLVVAAGTAAVIGTAGAVGREERTAPATPAG